MVTEPGDEIPCTAVENAGEDRPNVLMIPPCACPRCKPVPVELVTDDDGWLRVSGRRQRLRVESVELGDTGTRLLGAG